MGFIVPKYKVSAPPATPDPLPQEEQVENNTFDALSEKRKKRKGLEATLLTAGSQESAPPSMEKKSTDEAGSVRSSQDPSSVSTGVEMNRKTLG